MAPLLLIGLVAWAGWSWLRYGRDPVYLDDASILRKSKRGNIGFRDVISIRFDGQRGRPLRSTNHDVNGIAACGPQVDCRRVQRDFSRSEILSQLEETAIAATSFVGRFGR